MKNFIGKFDRKRPLRKSEIRWWPGQRWFSKFWFIRHSTTIAAVITRIFYFIYYYYYYYYHHYYHHHHHHHYHHQSYPSVLTEFLNILFCKTYLTLKKLSQVSLLILSNTNFNLRITAKLMCPVCRMLQHPANRTHNPQIHTRQATWKPQHEIPQAATTA